MNNEVFLSLCSRNQGLHVWVLLYPYGCLFARLDVRGTDFISVHLHQRIVTQWLTAVPAIHSKGRFFLCEFWARPCKNGTTGETKNVSFSKGLAKATVTAGRSSTMFSTDILLYSTRMCVRHLTPLAQILLHARKIMWFVTFNVVTPSLSVPNVYQRKQTNKRGSFTDTLLKWAK